MTISDWLTILALIVPSINTVYIIWASVKKNKSEVKKLSAEGDSEIAEGAKLIAEGAQVSSTTLLNRINELQSALENEKQARKEDVRYFNRRLLEMDNELRSYRNWTAQLSKQVLQAGQIPAPYIPYSDTDRNIKKPE